MTVSLINDPSDFVPSPPKRSRQFESEISEVPPMNEQDRRRREDAETDRDRAQRALDRAWQRMRDEEEEDRRLHRQIDPFNWGHWN
jgi:hypothetical protein